MVRLSKIYTRTGDDGSTGLGDGTRVSKTDPRVEAYGTVDEASAAIGWCITQCAGAPAGDGVDLLLRSIQNDLFDVGADLCCPIAPDEAAGQRLRVTAAQTKRLEDAIDSFNKRLSPLNSFVLPGGSPLAAALHVARTVVRRAERLVVALQVAEPRATSSEVVKYLNRLSDLLFVLARVANNDGNSDVLWTPGQNR